MLTRKTCHDSRGRPQTAYGELLVPYTAVSPAQVKLLRAAFKKETGLTQSCG